jgi:hypothetical protein
VQALFAHHEILTNRITFAILGVSFIIEGTTFGIAMKELMRDHPQKKLKNIFTDADPVTLAVVYEDGVALL